MPGSERSVLHVLPHPGGGGETYVDLLEEMPGYHFSRFFLASSPRPSARELARGVAGALHAGRHHELVHVHGEVAAGLCLPLLVTRASVVTLHGLHLARRAGGAARRAAMLNLRALLRAADRTICVSESEHAELVHLVGKGARRAVVVRNGVHVPPATSTEARRATRESLGVAASDPVAIWVGSLDERKEPLAAVRAAEEAGITLIVVGDGPLRSEVENGASEHVRVLGSRGDVPALLAASDIFVLTSRREGLAFSLLEAMAHGLVPVVIDLRENREAIGGAGIAVRDDDSLLSTLRRLAANPDERVALGAAAARRAAHLFSADEMVRRTRVVYDDVA